MLAGLGERALLLPMLFVGSLGYRVHHSAIMRRAVPALDHTMMCMAPSAHATCCTTAPAAFTSLALLPCEPMDAVLPGETMEWHLGEAWECRMLERAVECDGCFALLLKHDAHTAAAGDALTDADAAYDVAAEWLPLLQVMEIRQPDDAGGIEGFVCVKARCISRVTLTEAPRRRGRDAFETAAAAAYVDRDVLTTADALARTAEAAPLHASCRRLEEGLWPRSASMCASMCASMRARHASAAERRADSEEVMPSEYIPTYRLTECQPCVLVTRCLLTTHLLQLTTYRCSATAASASHPPIASRRCTPPGASALIRPPSRSSPRSPCVRG